MLINTYCHVKELVGEKKYGMASEVYSSSNISVFFLLIIITNHVDSNKC